MLSSNRNIFIFTQRIYETTERQFMKYNVLKSTLKGHFLVFKDFDQSNNSGEKFMFYEIHIRFLCYLESDKILS